MKTLIGTAVLACTITLGSLDSVEPPEMPEPPDPPPVEQPPVEEPPIVDRGEYIDDTYACLTQYEGQVFDLSGVHYERFEMYAVGSTRLPPESRFDARDGIFYQQKFPEAPNSTAIKLSSASVNWSSVDGVLSPFCVAGGVFIGTNPPDMTWREAKISPRGRAMTLVSDRTILDGNRIENIGEDGIGIFVNRARRAHTDYYRHTFRNLWFSNIFDDAIEETQAQSMLVEDVLFDGVMQAVATDPASGESDAYRNNVVTLNQVLIRTHPVLYERDDDKYYHGFGLKMRSKVPNSWDIQDSVFAWDNREVDHGAGFGSRLAQALRTTDSCSGNVIAWMGDTPFPSDVLINSGAADEIDRLNDEFPGCFTVIEGQEARDFWEGARNNWINCHPEVGRVPAGASPATPEGDPASDFSKCNAYAYGGGGTDIHATIHETD